MYEDSRIRRIEEEIDRRKDEMFEFKDDIEKLREKIAREEKTSRKNEHFNELDLVQKETKILENEVRNRLSRNKIQRIEAENSHKENTISNHNYKKQVKEIAKRVNKNGESLTAITAISKNNLLDYSKEDNYRNICTEYDDCFAIERIIKDINSIDKRDNDIEKNVLKGIMKDEEFINMVKEADNAQKSIISTVRDKDEIDRDNLKAELDKITDLPKPFHDFSIKEYKDDVNYYVNTTDFYSYTLENVPYSDKREVNLAPAASLAEKASEAAWKNLSHKTIKALDKSVDVVAKLEVIHKLKAHLVSIHTKEYKIGKYDFTEAQDKVKQAMEKLEKYEKDLKQQLDKTNYHEIDIEKEDNALKAEMNREMRQETRGPVDKAFHKMNSDGEIEILSSVSPSTNSELDDMLAGDKLNNLPNNMTPEMVVVASDILFRNGMVESNDVNSLSANDMDKSIEYAGKIQTTFKGMSEHEVAEQMAKDPWVDEKGNYHQREEITPMDVMAQENINRTHNVYNRINSAYGFTDEQNMTM